MSALLTIQSHGLRVAVVDGKLHAGPAERLTDDMRRWLRANAIAIKREFECTRSRAWLIHLTDGQRYPAVTRAPCKAAEIRELMTRQFGDRIAGVEPWRRPGHDARAIDRHDLAQIGAGLVFGADLEPWT